VTDHGDDLDRAEALERAEREAAIARHRAFTAALVALHDIEAGDCTDCGESIAPARKAAAPWTTRCVGCQQQFERGRG